nr:hypothetical protein [Tanacetum cinerariifolium]
MNQNFYNSNSSGFDQTQPPQFPIIHPPPQETSIEILHDEENVINAVQTFLMKFNRYSFFETPKVLLLAWDRVFKIKDAFGNEQYKLEDIQELFRKLLDDLQNIHEELAEYINTPGWNRPAFRNDDDWPRLYIYIYIETRGDDVDYTIAITPVLSTKEPDNSLSMGDEHLDTIPVTKSDKVIKSSVEDLVPIPTKDHFEIVINSKDDYSSSDDDSLYYENIEYVESSPYDSELVSLEVAKIVIPKNKEIKDDNLCEKLLKSSSTSPRSFLEETNTFDNSLPEFKNFCFDLEEISSGSTTTHSDISLSEYDSFIFDLSNDQFPPTDRSNFSHEEFADELTHIISPPEYDCFYFRDLPIRSVEDKILVPKLPENCARCAKCGHPVNGPYRQGCALLREKLEKDLITYLKYFQDTSELSDDSTNVVNAPRDPFVVKKDHGVNPPQIDKCCCECGEALDGIYCQRCICKSCGKGAHISACCDDDDDYDSAITPVLSTEEPIDFLSMGDEHLDTIPATESDEVIKSSVEDLVPIPSEFEGIPDTMCDVHLDNNPTPLEEKNYFETVINSKDDISSSDDDSLHEENIEYVEASPHDSELVSLEAAEIVIPKETNTYHNSLPDFENFYFDLEEISSGSTTTHSDISLPDYEAFYFDDDHIKEICSGSTTTHYDISLSEYDSFIFDFAHEEFADELAHIITPPEYDRFYFWNLPDP